MDFATGGRHATRHGLLQLATLSRLLLQMHKSQLHWRIRALLRAPQRLATLSTALTAAAQAIASDLGGKALATI